LRFDFRFPIRDSRFRSRFLIPNRDFQFELTRHVSDFDFRFQFLISRLHDSAIPRLRGFVISRFCDSTFWFRDFAIYRTVWADPRATPLYRATRGARKFSSQVPNPIRNRGIFVIQTETLVQLSPVLSYLVQLTNRRETHWNNNSSARASQPLFRKYERNKRFSHQHCIYWYI